MGRKNMSEERRAMILDAFEVCVGKYGFDGTSLERVAEQAGFRRGLVRHYLGNRDDMVLALAKRMVARYYSQVDELLAHMGAGLDVAGVVALFFPQQDEDQGDHEVMMMEHLIAVSRRYPDIQTMLTEWLDDFVTRLAAVLSGIYPQAGEERAWQAAYGLIGLYFNEESMASVQLPARYNEAARQSATALLTHLLTAPKV
ncbi:TetR/AcrR family transcriptional regulator [Acanthopleuribacter pedis]|uniref:TetR/AcrR family transcriptional regulator n=1 Tax=Acanthopleuribacter pedis TaxID=442870 RepID=A0A8J7U6S4_9BACT|nr:TetR/AcrR family transcriptional regulator [Acanthopleuribacter pedis]MBO1322229.1 TetR/AcrR family transcriptional regulator [Acanthopleuribacter pedis]